MSIQDKVGAMKTNAEPTVTPSAGAGVPPVTPSAGTASKGKGKGATPVIKFREQGATIREKYTEEEKAFEGSMSDSVQFVISLVDPSQPQKKVINGEDKQGYATVGYKFKALKDIEVPKAPMMEGWEMLMDCVEPEWIPVKAGEEFVLTSAENSRLISKPEFGGCYSGGGDKIITLITISKSTKNRPNLVLKREKGSLKESTEMVADVTTNPVTGKKVYTVKPEYAEKFGFLYNKSSANTGSGGSGSTESYKDYAAAFLAYTKKK